MQADSGSDSDSRTRNKNEEIILVNCLTQTVCTDLPEPATTVHTYTVKQRTYFAPAGAKNVLCLTVQVRTVVAGSGGSVQTVGVRRFTRTISSFLFLLSESESEPESACTIHVPLCTFMFFTQLFTYRLLRILFLIHIFNLLKHNGYYIYRHV